VAYDVDCLSPGQRFNKMQSLMLKQLHNETGSSTIYTVRQATLIIQSLSIPKTAVFVQCAVDWTSPCKTVKHAGCNPRGWSASPTNANAPFTPSASARVDARLHASTHVDASNQTNVSIHTDRVDARQVICIHRMSDVSLSYT